MSRRFPILFSTLAVGIPLLFAVSVRAAEESGSAGAPPVEMTFKWVHFVILAVVVIWLFGFKLPATVFRPKAAMISEAISKATAAKAEADRQLREAAVKMTTLDQEVAAFKAAALKESTAEVQRLRTATLSEAEKIKAAGKAEIAATERAARVELKEIAAKLAVDKAESLVAQQMTPGVQDALISNFVQSLQGRPN
jgi:F0F1-type ATP synthase membrane subunit b/b'